MLSWEKIDAIPGWFMFQSYCVWRALLDQQARVSGDLFEIGPVVVPALELLRAAHAQVPVRVDDGVAPLERPFGAIGIDEHFPQTHFETSPIRA